MRPLQTLSVTENQPRPPKKAGGRYKGKSKPELQRLKPLGFGVVYVVAKATTHKESCVLTHTLKPRPANHSALWLEADAAPQLGAVVHDAVGDDEFDFANIANGFQRIGVEDDHIGALARFHGTDFLVEPHHARRHDRCGLNCFHRGESRLNVQLDLAVQAVAGKGLIPSSDNPNARSVPRADDSKFFRNNFFVEIRLGRRRADVRKNRLQFRRYLYHSWLDAGRGLGSARGEKLEKRDGGIHYRAVLHQKGNRFQRGGGIQIQICLRCGAIEAAGILGQRWNHDVHDIGDVIDLVLAQLNGLIRVQTDRHMTGDRHAEAVRFLRDIFDFFELHGTVNLHLLKTGVVVFVRPHFRLLGRVHALHSGGARTGAIHDSG